MKFLVSAKNQILAAVVMLLTLMCMMPAQAQSPVSRSLLEQMFANIAKDTQWNMSGNMLWGYFFTHPSRAPLEAAAKELALKGYRVVDLHLIEKEDPKAPDSFILHVERVEHHSVSSLDKRNIELALFAKQRNLASYDGMDVGPVGSIKK